MVITHNSMIKQLEVFGCYTLPPYTVGVQYGNVRILFYQDKGR